MARRLTSFQHEVRGARYALHFRRAKDRILLAAVDGGVANPEIGRVLARAVARVGDEPEEAWPDAVARALGECLEESEARAARITSLVYLGLVAGEHDVSVVHAGDLRACLLEDGELPRCTRDHTTRFDPPSEWLPGFASCQDDEVYALVHEGALLTRSIGYGTRRPPARTTWLVTRPYALLVASAEYHRHLDNNADVMTRRAEQLGAESLWARVACE